MISFLFSSIFFLLFLKEVTLFGSFILLEYPYIYLIFLFPLLFFLVYYCSFNTSSMMEDMLFKLLVSSFFVLLAVSFVSSSPFTFLFFLEMCVLLNILFLFNYSKDLDKISSTFFMVLFNISGSIPFFWFCAFASNTTFLSSSNSIFAMLCFCLLLCSKLPIFLLHFWLTKAHVSASGSGSMILASLMLKIGSVGLAKWSFLFSSLFLFSSFTFFSFSLWSSIFFLLVMIRFFDLKYLVACSSVTHMSVLFPLFLFNSNISFFSCSMMMVSHSLISCLIFFLVTLLYEVCYERSISASKSLESFCSIFSMVMFFWFLMNLGFPPFLSFMSELYFFLFFFCSDFFFSALFFLILMLSGMVFFSVASNFLYSKKSQTLMEDFSLYVNSVNLLYFGFFFLMCFFS